MKDQVLYNDNFYYYTKLKKKQVELQIIIKILYNRIYKIIDHINI